MIDMDVDLRHPPYLNLFFCHHMPYIAIGLSPYIAIICHRFTIFETSSVISPSSPFKPQWLVAGPQSRPSWNSPSLTPTMLGVGSRHLKTLPQEIPGDLNVSPSAGRDSKVWSHWSQLQMLRIAGVWIWAVSFLFFPIYRWNHSGTT